jgi:type IV secretion system protein VirD4
VLAHLRLFDSDLVRRLTDTSSIDMDALIAGEPMSLYMIVPPARLTAYRPLLRLWLSGLILALTHRKSSPKERTLMLCDEVGNRWRLCRRHHAHAQGRPDATYRGYAYPLPAGTLLQR